MDVKREFFEVHLTVVEANGNVTLDPTGYPKIEDSKLRDNDIYKAYDRARSLLGAAESDMGVKRDTRQIQYAYLVRGSDGKQLEVRRFGSLADIVVPDPEESEE
jgi:hypothetical protein